MNPADIPTSVMAMGNVPMRVAYPKQMPTPETMREILAHYWPAIEQHIRQQIADDINAEADRLFEKRDNPSMHARALATHRAADIARGTHRPAAIDIPAQHDTARDQNNHDAYTL